MKKLSLETITRLSNELTYQNDKYVVRTTTNNERPLFTPSYADELLLYKELKKLGDYYEYNLQQHSYTRYDPLNIVEVLSIAFELTLLNPRSYNYADFQLDIKRYIDTKLKRLQRDRQYEKLALEEYRDMIEINRTKEHSYDWFDWYGEFEEFVAGYKVCELLQETENFEILDVDEWNESTNDWDTVMAYY